VGVAFLPVFDDRDDEWPNDINGKSLARAANRLDKAVKKARVGSIYEFYSMSREQFIAEALDADPDDPESFDEADVQPVRWHDPAAGLRVIDAMLAWLRDHPQEIDDSECVREDLDSFKTHLQAAVARGARWHLEIDA